MPQAAVSTSGMSARKPPDAVALALQGAVDCCDRGPERIRHLARCPVEDIAHDEHGPSWRQDLQGPHECQPHAIAQLGGCFRACARQERVRIRFEPGDVQTLLAQALRAGALAEPISCGSTRRRRVLKASRLVCMTT
jgi:hypothetical protein